MSSAASIIRPGPAKTVVALLLLGAASGCTSQQGDAGNEFRDCDGCPTMLTMPPGRFLMGTAVADRLIDPRTGAPATNDGPQHPVEISRPFAIGKTEVTVEQFAAFVAATGYATVDRCMEFSAAGSFSLSNEVNWENTGFRQSPEQPAVCVSFFDAQAYANWLGNLTGKAYRLPSEAEWEYAARAGATGPYFWGDSEADACIYANVRSTGADTISKRQVEADKLGFPCDDGYAQSSPAGSFAPNAAGLYDMQGNAWEWVADCNHKDYAGAPQDGSAWLDDNDKSCRFGVIRGGSFLNLVERSSVTVRAGRPRSAGATNMGFRVALGENPTASGDSREWQAVAMTDNGGPGARLFIDNCEACHLSSRDFEGLYGTSREDLIDAISGGGNNTMSMPAFADRLTATEIGQLADYLRRVNDWE